MTSWRDWPLDMLANVVVSTVDKKQYEGETPVRLCNYTDVYYNDFITAAIDFMEATATPDQIQRFAVRAGDVVITKDSETSSDIGRPAFVPNDLPGVVYGYHLAVYRPLDHRYGRFLKYAFDSASTRAELARRTPGVTRVGLSQDTLRNLRIPAPSPDDARQIADYLDHETAEIDAFIADLITMATLTRERFESELSASMIGPFPRVNIRRVADMRTGHTPSRAVAAYWIDPDIPWFTLADVWQLRRGSQFLGQTKELISALGVANSAAEVLPAGTVVLSRTASVGFTGIMPRPMATSQDFWNWVCGPLLKPEFLWNQFRAMKPEFERLKSGSTHKTIYQADAAALTVIVPPIGVQAATVDQIARTEGTIKAELADIDAAIALAKERRAALITAAVTGQIDVTAKQMPAVDSIQTAIEEAR